MLRYDIAKLAQTVSRHRPGTGTQLPQMQTPIGVEQAFLKTLRAMLRELAKVVRADILPVVERELQQQRQVTTDVSPETFERLSQLAGALVRVSTNTVRRILGLEARRHTENFMKSAKRTLGVDLSAVVRVDDLADYLETATTRSAGLIKGLADDVAARVSTTVTNAVSQGKTVTELRKMLTEQFGFADKRAKLIARDQTAKFNSALNRIRHTQAGITEYVWRTSRDERVRPRHEKLDGIQYEYGKPTGAEQGLPPGQPIQCRCIAQAVVEF